MPFQYEPIHAETKIGSIILNIGRVVILVVELAITLFIFIPFLYLVIGFLLA